MQPRLPHHREVLLPSVQLSKTASQNCFQITYNSFLKNNTLTFPFITSTTMMSYQAENIEFTKHLRGGFLLKRSLRKETINLA